VQVEASSQFGGDVVVVARADWVVVVTNVWSFARLPLVHPIAWDGRSRETRIATMR